MLINKEKPPRISEIIVKSTLEKAYGISGTIEKLSGERDQNFLITAAEGNKFSVKISNIKDGFELIEMQNKLMDHVNKHSSETIAPRVLVNWSGAKFTNIRGDDDRTYILRVFNYISGTFLSEIKNQDEKLLSSLGYFLGNLSSTLNDFSYSSPNRVLSWDIRNTNLLGDYLIYIKNVEKKRIIDYFLLQFENELSPILPKLRNSFIHNDANDSNLLVRKKGDGSWEVFAIIDFGDCRLFQTGL